MTWKLVVTKSAQKNLQKLPLKDLERVKAALLAMSENPFSGDIVRLKGRASDRGHSDPPTHPNNVLRRGCHARRRVTARTERLDGAVKIPGGGKVQPAAAGRGMLPNQPEQVVQAAP